MVCIVSKEHSTVCMLLVHYYVVDTLVYCGNNVCIWQFDGVLYGCVKTGTHVV